jgi:hypothetical protein
VIRREERAGVSDGCLTSVLTYRDQCSVYRGEEAKRALQLQEGKELVREDLVTASDPKSPGLRELDLKTSGISITGDDL